MLVKAKDILQNTERQGYRGGDVLLTLKNRERQGYRGGDVLLTLKSRERQVTGDVHQETCC